MRTCSGCTLCCTLMPIKQMGKKANVRCQHEIALTGCAIYADRPTSCRLWHCAWIGDPQTKHLDRPDVSRYVIDPSPDSVVITDDDTGKKEEMAVLQIWCDPNFPDAHRDPKLREMLNENHAIAIVRYSETEAVILFPPTRSSDGEWHEMTDSRMVSQDELNDIIGGIG